MMGLRIGVLKSTVGWQLLLRQEGVTWENIVSWESLNDFNVVVASRVREDEIKFLRSYLHEGGSLLTTTEVIAHLSHQEMKSDYIRYLLPDEQFPDIGLSDLERQCLIPREGNILKSDRGKFSGYAGSVGRGFVVALPFDPAEVVLENAVATRSFYAKGSRLPFERIAAIPKGSIRHILSRALQLLHHYCGLPYVHRWYFPAKVQSMFNLRIDTDYANKQEIEKLYSLVKAMNIPATWFVDVKSQEDCIEIFAAMEGQEIGIHGYEHREYLEYKDAVENIRKAMDIFQMHGIEAEGFAAPYGVWKEELARASTHCGFVYSTEFSYDYDGLPSFPIVNGSEISTLQVPVHPISLGSLRRQGFSVQEMKEYFSHVITMKVQRREPVFLYHHPKNGYEEVLCDIVETIRQQKIPVITLGKYARWWQQRDECIPTVEYENGLLTVQVETIPENLWMRISRADGKEAFTPIKKIIDSERLEWQAPPQLPQLPNDIHRIRSFNPWIPFIRFQDLLSKIIRMIFKKLR